MMDGTAQEQYEADVLALLKMAMTESLCFVCIFQIFFSFILHRSFNSRNTRYSGLTGPDQVFILINWITGTLYLLTTRTTVFHALLYIIHEFHGINQRSML